MASLKQFDPAIDRHDRRRAEHLFKLLWPDATVARAVATNLAASIEIAHAAADSSWVVSLFKDYIRLSVGQVETLTLRDTSIRFFFQEPLELDHRHEFVFKRKAGPIFRSVPVPSGRCDVPSAEIPLLPDAVRMAHEAYIQSATLFKRVSPFARAFSPAVLEYVESLLDVELPRPNYALTEPLRQRDASSPENLGHAAALLEGARYQVRVDAYERNPRARQLCIAKHGTDCVICGFSFVAVYGRVADGFIHVHHLRPLSEIGGEYEIDPVEDLRPVCPNCHAVLHRRIPAYSISEVRAFVAQQAPIESGTVTDQSGA